MRALTRLTAAAQLALIFPSALFLTSVLVSAGRAPQYDLARIARHIVSWYVARTWTLPVLLLALPCIALVAGCGAMMRERRSLAMIPAPVATLLVAGSTMTSAGLLAVVALHMLAN